MNLQAHDLARKIEDRATVVAALIDTRNTAGAAQRAGLLVVYCRELHARLGVSEPFDDSPQAGTRNESPAIIARKVVRRAAMLRSLIRAQYTADARKSYLMLYTDVRALAHEAAR